jgi:hypothetical protein
VRTILRSRLCSGSWARNLAASDETAKSLLRDSMNAGRLFDLLVPGLYAWGVTVAWPVSNRFASLGSRIFALVAVVALVAGAVLRASSPALARIIGIWFFLASCVAAWALVGSSILPTQLDPVQGLLGSVGWALFAMGWAGQKKIPPGPVEPTPVATQPAVPRKKLPRRSVFMLSAVAVAAAVPMALAWWVTSVERALLAHAVSLAAAIALVAFAADIFDPRTRQAGRALALVRPERRLATAAPALVALVAVILAGAAYSLLR